MANQDGEMSAPSFTGPHISATASEGWRLPMLFTARPGNVGVQIDSHRAMNLFSHPRSVKFTAQFHGVMYEDGSLENYSRVVERTAQRARLVHEKLEKLKAREQYLLEDELKRRQRRAQREAARQRQLWQMQQAAKQADERARESAAATTVQRVMRGALARRTSRVLKQIRMSNQAASMLQHAMKAYVCRQNFARERERRAREMEARHELEMNSAASVLQRQARKRLQMLHNNRAQAALTSMAEDEENDEDEELSKPTELVLISPPAKEISTDEKIIAEAISRGISLDLLFSDDEDAERTRHTDATSSSSTLSTEASSLVKLPQPPPKSSAVRRPRRPMSVKRVGGGYRTRLLPYAAAPVEEATAAAPATFRAVRPQKTSQAVTNLTATPSTRDHTDSTSSKSVDDLDIRAASPVQSRFKSPYAIAQRLVENSHTSQNF